MESGKDNNKTVKDDKKQKELRAEAVKKAVAEMEERIRERESASMPADEDDEELQAEEHDDQKKDASAVDTAAARDKKMRAEVVRRAVMQMQALEESRKKQEESAISPEEPETSAEEEDIDWQDADEEGSVIDIDMSDYTGNSEGENSFSTEDENTEPDEEAARTVTSTDSDVNASDDDSSDEGDDKGKDKKNRKSKKTKKKKAKKQKKEKKSKPMKKDSEKLSFLGRGAAAMINGHDFVQAKVDHFFINIWHSIGAWIYNMATTYSGSLAKMTGAVMALLVASCAVFIVLEHSTVYEYAYNGRPLGYVKDESTVTDLLDVAGKNLAQNNGDSRIKFTANDNITFNKVTGRGKDVDDPDQVINKLTYMTDIEVKGTAIYQNGKLLTVVENDKAAKKVLNNVKKHYSTPDDGMQIDEVNFKDDITQKPFNIMLASIQSQKSASDTLVNGGDVELQHMVTKGETVQSIADEFNTTPDQIYDRSGENKASKLEDGQVVTVKKTIDPMKVRTVESGSMVEAIAYKSEKQDSGDYFKGETHVQQQGSDGRQKITGKVIKENGKIVKRDLKSKEVIAEPVNEIILVGTSDKPKETPTGTFIAPVKNYTLSSRFGARWGRMHEGVDLAASTGTPVYAADGGTVIRAGTYGGYGNCIDIDHGNGVVTRYGHNSKLEVTVGQKVYQGQEIAKMGSTGHSTGPHCHFEIRINGKAIDPLTKVKL